MKKSDLVQRGSTIQVTCNTRTNEVDERCEQFSICGCTTFQMKISKVEVLGKYRNRILVRFFKNCQVDDLTYSITLSSNKLCLKEKTFTSDDSTWHSIMLIPEDLAFDISIVMDIVRNSTFKTLYNDTELTDFELRAEDGSVKVHKAVLAASSPVLRRMLSGSWRETTEGHVNVPGTSVQTLQHFIDYIYIDTLPHTGLEQILLLASYYMIPDLEQKCVNKLVNSLTVQNACDMIEFAAKHKITRLVLAIVHSIRNNEVKFNDIRQNFLNCQDNNCEK